VAVPAPDASRHTLLVATTRERDLRPGTLFNGNRANALDFAEVTVSVPPNHTAGKIEWPSEPKGDPNLNFVAQDESYLDGDRAFVQALNTQLAARPKGTRNVFVFIHGFNTLFVEGLYRETQIVHDSRAPGVPVLFTWASRGKPAAYLYDTNSATAARDALEHTPRLLLASKAEQVNILAHSMGNWVTVEALRQIKISGDLDHANNIGQVFLAAPDIDIDVFKSQMRRFGRPKKPFYVVLCKDDRALWLSDTIAGEITRVGDDANVAELADLGATVIDLTDLKANDDSNHGIFAQLAAVAPELREVLTRGTGANSSSLTPVADGVDNPLSFVVSLPAGLLGAPAKVISAQ